MDLVLGLSVTSTAVRWVLVEGMSGEGAPVDRGALDITDDEPFDADGLLSVLLDANEPVVESGVHAVGVTWTTDADAAALAVLEALDARGVQNVVSVSEIEAAEALAGGIADIAGYDDVAVCIFEPDATLVAVVNADGVTVDRQDRPADGDDDVELTGSVIALDLNDRQLDSIFVVGSSDLDTVVSSMDTVAAAPVISSAEAHMAMARGAAVAVGAGGQRPGRCGCTAAEAARDVEDRRVDVRRCRRGGHLGGLALGCAGSSATPDSRSEQTKNANATGQQVREGVPSAAKAARAAPKLAPRPAAPPEAGARRKAAEARSRGTPTARGAAGRPDDGRCASGSRRARHRIRPPLRPARAGALRTSRPRRPRRMFRRNRRSRRCSRNRVCATRSSSAFRSSTGSTTRSLSTRRGSRATALYMTRKANVHSLFA